MLVVETVARIRREHFIKGKTIKEIARDLRVSRNTVRKVLRSGETSFEYEREVQPRPKLGHPAHAPEHRDTVVFISQHHHLLPGARACRRDDFGHDARASE